ncbi:hypothetical protein C8J56DRAFT_191413 [Mycena floridula]|nr:hypothetical protein C8J56DRAFT_191413 [Mycena floridula]
MDAVETQLADLGRFPSKESNPSVFNSYVREANVFDKAMVARWKVTMNGIVIFAALFSGVVTAFIIESHKMLSPDPQQVMIVIMYQMSQQLSSVVNGSQTSAVVPTPDDLFPFAVPPAVLVTNIVWFISLGLSLACALTATLIQQWASDYTHAIERRQDPEKRGRIRAFLFEGVETSNLPAIVEATPLLLHASLFSFLIGLVFFISPLNTVVTFLLIAILAICGSAYLCATIIPLIVIASPIRTPLSTFIFKSSVVSQTLRLGIIIPFRVMRNLGSGIRKVWKAFRREESELEQPTETTNPYIQDMPTPSWSFRTISAHCISLFRQAGILEMPSTVWTEGTIKSGNLDFAREEAALRPRDPNRQDRELRALSWTFDGLTTDIELLPFIEAIPSFLAWGQHGAPPEMYSRATIMRGILPSRRSNVIFLVAERDNATARTCSAVLKACSALLENRVIPTIGIIFILRFCDAVNRAKQFPTLSTLLSTDVKYAEFMMLLQYAETCIDKREVITAPNIPHIIGIIKSNLQDVPVEVRESFEELFQVYRRSQNLVCPALLALCSFSWTELPRLPERMQLRNSHAMIRGCVTLVATLATSTDSDSQEAYALGVWIITAAVNTTSDDIATKLLHQSVSRSLLEPLLQITAPSAVKTVQKIFQCPVWVAQGTPENFGWRLDLLRRYAERDEELLQFYLANALREPWRWDIDDVKTSAHTIMNKLQTLSGFDSTTQIRIMGAVKSVLDDSYMSLSPPILVDLFRLISTLDDPQAVDVARQLLFKMVESRTSGAEEAAAVALAALDAKSKDPVFSWRALSIR